MTTFRKFIRLEGGTLDARNWSVHWLLVDGVTVERADGGLLRDGESNRFIPACEPKKKELASRDVVSRRMEEHIANATAALDAAVKFIDFSASSGSIFSSRRRKSSFLFLHMHPGIEPLATETDF